MRVESFDPTKFDATLENVAVERLVMAAELVASKAKANCPTGTVSRPAYQKGKHAGKEWTSRQPGRLRDTIRVERERTKSGAISRSKKAQRRVAVAMGNELAYYAAAVEYCIDGKPVLRPALWNSIPQIKSILGVR